MTVCISGFVIYEYFFIRNYFILMSDFEHFDKNEEKPFSQKLVKILITTQALSICFLSVLFVFYLKAKKNQIQGDGSRKTIIGIAGHRLFSPIYQDYGIYSENSYACFTKPFHRLNTTTRILPVIENFTDLDIKSTVDGIHALIFQGGYDVTPSFYGQEPKPELGTINTILDLYHIAIYKEAKSRGIPIFGFCRGFQLINIIENGTMYQDQSYYPVPSNMTRINHRILTNVTDGYHNVTIYPNTILHSLFNKDTIFTNSIHHQIVDRIGSIFKVVAVSQADGVPEAVERKDGGSFIMGTQFHPEFHVWKSDEFLPVFQLIVNEANKFRSIK